MTIDPREAAIIQRIFKAFADGQSESSIVRELNRDGTAGRRKASKGWSPSTVHRVLRCEKYVGRWVWNKSETRRDPRTGRRRQFRSQRRSGWSQTTSRSALWPTISGTACRHDCLKSARRDRAAQGSAASKGSGAPASVTILRTCSRAP